MKASEGRIAEEQRTVRAMVHLYCRSRHGVRDDVCGECGVLLEYALSRLARCPHGDGKPTCRYCEVHCYRPEMKRRICEVMRYSGPRMVLHHPAMALRHLLREFCR